MHKQKNKHLFKVFNKTFYKTFVTLQFLHETLERFNKRVFNVNNVSLTFLYVIKTFL